MKLTLAFLLRDLGDAGERAALGLADLVMSPLLFLGGALLYVDQAARVRSSALGGGVSGTSRASRHRRRAPPALGRQRPAFSSTRRVRLSRPRRRLRRRLTAPRHELQRRRTASPAGAPRLARGTCRRPPLAGHPGGPGVASPPAPARQLRRPTSTISSSRPPRPARRGRRADDPELRGWLRTSSSAAPTRTCRRRSRSWYCSWSRRGPGKQVEPRWPDAASESVPTPGSPALSSARRAFESSASAGST